MKRFCLGDRKGVAFNSALPQSQGGEMVQAASSTQSAVFLSIYFHREEITLEGKLMIEQQLW